MASRIPLALSLLRLRKKLTVMGMIGHTQGVKRASSPPANPMMKRYQIELFFSERPSCACSSWMTGCHKSVPTAVAEESTAASLTES